MQCGSGKHAASKSSYRGEGAPERDYEIWKYCQSACLSTTKPQSWGGGVGGSCAISENGLGSYLGIHVMQRSHWLSASLERRTELQMCVPGTHLAHAKGFVLLGMQGKP